MQFSKVDQQAETIVAESQVREKLCLMDWKEMPYGLELDQDTILHEQSALYARSIRCPSYTIGSAYWVSTRRPFERSSYARHASYACSSSPGPSAECTLNAASSIWRL